MLRSRSKRIFVTERRERFADVRCACKRFNSWLREDFSLLTSAYTSGVLSPIGASGYDVLVKGMPCEKNSIVRRRRLIGCTRVGYVLGRSQKMSWHEVPRCSALTGTCALFDRFVILRCSAFGSFCLHSVNVVHVLVSPLFGYRAWALRGFQQCFQRFFLNVYQWLSMNFKAVDFQYRSNSNRDNVADGVVAFKFAKFFDSYEDLPASVRPQRQKCCADRWVGPCRGREWLSVSEGRRMSDCRCRSSSSSRWQTGVEWWRNCSIKVGDDKESNCLLADNV